MELGRYWWWIFKERSKCTTRTTDEYSYKRDNSFFCPLVEALWQSRIKVVINWKCSSERQVTVKHPDKCVWRAKRMKFSYEAIANHLQ